MESNPIIRGSLSRLPNYVKKSGQNSAYPIEPYSNKDSPRVIKRRAKITFENSPYCQSEMKQKSISLLPNQVLLINTVHCKGEYSLIKNVIRENGWKETQSLGKGHILWYGNGLNETDRVLVNNRSCWYNRYVGAAFLSFKKQFHQILRRAENIFPEEYSQMIPRTFFLPEERQQLEDALTGTKGITFIAKPSKGYGGIGIQLLQKISDIVEIDEEKDFVVSEYIKRPLLLERQILGIQLEKEEIRYASLCSSKRN